MCYVPDVLGSGFETIRLDLEPDRFSPRSATLIRYVPGKDPKALWPDRVVPDNLRPGGGTYPGSYTVLPPNASPQQPEDAPIYSDCRPLPVGKKYPPSEDVSTLRDYLDRELDGRGLSVASSWSVPSQPRFALVYVHGWNDYFYQPHLARMFSCLGGAFYALDLHRYGRNLSGWPAESQVWNCYTEDYADYDPELDWAVARARQDHPGLPVIVMGHSNGGGVVAAWAARHHHAFDGLIFNSPWIVHDVSTIPAGKLLMRLIMDWGKLCRFPMPQFGPATYADSLAGYQALASPLPRRLLPFLNDPAVRGWKVNPRWRVFNGAPTLVSWAAAVFRNQRWLAQEAVFPSKPVLCLTANRQVDCRYREEIFRIDAILAKRHRASGSCKGVVSRGNIGEFQRHSPGSAPTQGGKAAVHGVVPALPKGWSEAARHVDTVLNGELIGERASKLFGSDLRFQLLSGCHDLTLSQPVERAEFFAQISDWLSGVFFS